MVHQELDTTYIREETCIMPFLPDISPELIDFLIRKEKEEQEKQCERPFLQIPAPQMPIIPQKDEKIEENEEIIVLDM